MNEFLFFLMFVPINYYLLGLDEWIRTRMNFSERLLLSISVTALGGIATKFAVSLLN